MVMIMGRWSDDSACFVVHDVLLYSVLDMEVMSGDDVCCDAVFGTLVGVSVLSIMCSEFIMMSAMICPL